MGLRCGALLPTTIGLELEDPMRLVVTASILAAAVHLSNHGVAHAAPAAAKLDTARIEELTGAKGKLDEKEGVFKVSVPRADLAVTAAGVRITPPLGLTSWAAFK